MGESGHEPDATRSLAPAASAGGRTAATAAMSDAGPPSPVDAPDAPTVTGVPQPGTTPVELLAVGTKLGRFQVLGRLGAGGMGVVYAAYDPELDRRVAVKLLGARDRSREANLRLLREAQAMARLSHPNVVSVYDVGDVDGRMVFLAMEYVDGQTLRQWLDATPRSWDEIRDVLVQAGRGLAAAHKTGLVHRDFKPGNVLIDAEGRAKVSDFGIARLDDSDDAPAESRPPIGTGSGITPLAIELTRTGTAIGTPAYMAPEQHRGKPVDARADQFAFCVTAWEAAYGDRPFAGKPAELLTAIEAGAPRPAKEAPGTPAWLEGALKRGLALAPDARWPTLDALIDRLGVDPAARRQRTVSIAAAAVAVAVIAGTATFLATRHDRDPCTGLDREVAATWNPTSRGGAEAAFTATGSPLAADHWKLVSTRIDTWSHAWVAGRRDACEQHLRHAQSDDLFDRRVACLARGKARVAALLDLMQHADAAIVRESAMATAVLPPPDDCGNVELLLDQRPLPTDPAVREAVAGYRATIERANALRTVGRYPDALALVAAALPQAKLLRYLPVEAELTYAVGMMQSDAHDPAAEATLRSAADVASEARYPQVYARVWLSLLWEIGVTRAKFDDAAPLRTLAWQSLHLAGDDPDLAATMEMHSGAVDLIHGDIPTAAMELQQAIAIIEHHKGTHSVDLVAPLNMLAVSMASSDPDGAKLVYERALAILGETVSPRHPRAGAILANLGNIAQDQGRLTDAIDLDRRALEIEEAALGPDSADLGASLNSLAQPLWALGKFDEAYQLIDRARGLWEQSLGPDHPYVAVAYGNLGGLRLEQGRCKEGMPLLDKALAIQIKAFGPDDPQLAMVRNYQAGCFNELGRPAEALPLARKALEGYTAHGRPVDQAGAKFEIARALWGTGDKAKALALATEARKTFEDDPVDQTMVKAGAKSGSVEIAAWLAGKTAK